MEQRLVVSRNEVRIDCRALRHNFRCITEGVGPGVAVMAMVKGDAYGHGMVETAAVLADCGCRTFGVAELVEAVALRGAGIGGDIFVILGFVPEEAEQFLLHDLTPVVFLDQDIRALSQAAVRHGREIGVHLKLDCGMGRLGLLPAEVPAFKQRIDALPGIFLAGVMAHLPEADQRQAASTPQIFSCFQETIARIGAGFTGIRHIANSGATMYFQDTHCEMVRAGISLYGCYPDGSDGADIAAGSRLQPVMSFATRVAQVRDLPAGSGISYGHTYITTRPTRIAVLPIGYEDGYLRDLSNKGEVLVHGRRAPIRGRICMNLCMADVTGIPGVTVGDEVVLLGRQGEAEITADEIAGWMGTISYEVLCLFGNNNSRIHIDGER
ncbi:MAG: alanine racemase [Desulfoprunum sp.]|uniref:alanine racemase n=1 Tax=Desulfoprunum sp. TaxID=2020866 RepID=UPI00267891B5